MEETYTFSRALHMMRYGGKKMKGELWQGGTYAFCVGDTLWVNGWDMRKKDYDTYVGNIDSEDIMGSWVEVRD